jgi:hypothetical protein
MIVDESFLKSLIKVYGRQVDRQVVYSDGGTWYPEACVFVRTGI